MKKSIKTGQIFEGTFGRLKLVKDFLPPPEVLKKAKTKIYHEDGTYTIYEARDEERKK